MVEYTQYALKGQKLLAQGIALGNYECTLSPCKGKSFKEPGNNKAFALTGRVGQNFSIKVLWLYS